MTDYTAVLTALYPDAEWTLSGDDYAGLTWLSDTPKPKKKTLDDAWPAVRDARAWDAVRAERDRLLAACDWATLKAVDASNDGLGINLPQVWVNYRQALRDVPQNFPTPDDVVWPTPPA